MEWVEPEGRNCVWVGVRGQALDEDLHGPEGLRLRIDDGDAGNEAGGAGLVVDTEFSRRHRALVPAKAGAPDWQILAPSAKIVMRTPVGQFHTLEATSACNRWIHPVVRDKSRTGWRRGGTALSDGTRELRAESSFVLWKKGSIVTLP